MKARGSVPAYGDVLEAFIEAKTATSGKALPEFGYEHM
jgi:hypothetical protein